MRMWLEMRRRWHGEEDTRVGESRKTRIDVIVLPQWISAQLLPCRRY